MIFPFFFTLAARLVDINNPATMSQTRVNLAAAKRELAERQDEANLCMVELRHAQEIMAAGGTGPKVLSVRSERGKERGKGKGYTTQRDRQTDRWTKERGMRIGLHSRSGVRAARSMSAWFVKPIGFGGL